jgi:adenylate kinase
MTEWPKNKELLKSMQHIVVFIGPEGSGKTTMALRLTEETGLPYISTGDIIRDLAASDFSTSYGQACREMFENHAYLDGQTLLEILALRLGKEDTKGGFILDGGMRTIEETEKFHLILEMAKRDHLPLKTVLLQAPEAVSIKRLVGEEGRNRADDTVEGVTKRLLNYHNKLEDRLNLIQSRENWCLVEVDATEGVEATYGRVIETILGI